MEIVKIVVFVIGAIEGLFLCIETHRRNNLLLWNNTLIDTIKTAQELEKKSRRDTEGRFGNPMQDGYRKNDKGQYTPIKPNGNPYAIRPHLGDDDNEL
jgi:hypothetical protein